MLNGLKAAMMKPINTSAVIILGVYTTVWGLWVATPLWDVFGTADLYSYMSQLAPELFWGLAAVVAGVVIVWGVIRNSYRSLIIGSWIGFMHWFLISALYFFGDWQNTGGITALAIGIYSAFVYLNLKVNHKKPSAPVEQDESQGYEGC
jgi:hypothetical protein